MAKASLGPAYRRMTAEQRADLTQKIEQDFLQTLSGGLAGYSNQKVKFFRPRQGSGQRASVTVGIANPGGYPSRLDFRLYHGAEGWKVYDVAANGNSAVNYYRQRFARNWSQSMPYPGRI